MVQPKWRSLKLMEQRNILLLLAFSLNTALSFWAPTTGNAATTNETITFEAAWTPTFPPKPAGLEKVFHQVGTPEFQDIPQDIALKLGGPGAKALLKAPFENLLLSSDRFKVLLNREGQYVIRGSITGLEVLSGSSKKKGGLDIIKRLPGIGWVGNLQTIANLADVDWTKDETKIAIECRVSIQLAEGSNSTLLIGQEGHAKKETTVKEIRAQLGGVELTKNGPPMQILVQYQTKVVEFALHDALVKMLPKVDDLLATASVKEAAPAPTPAVNVPAPAPVVTAKVETPAIPPAKTESAPAPTAEQRLRQLKDLHDKGLISKEDFDKKTKEILESL